MSESKKEERKEGKERKKPPKYRFQSVCVFGESNVGKEVEFITTTNELRKILIAQKINFMYRRGIQGVKRKCGTFSK